MSSAAQPGIRFSVPTANVLFEVYEIIIEAVEVFTLDLSGFSTDSQVPGAGGNPSADEIDAPDANIVSNNLVINFDSLGQSVTIPLSSDQVKQLTTAKSQNNTVTVTIDASQTGSGSFRFALRNPTLQAGWNGTGVISNMTGGVLDITDTSKIGGFVLQITNTETTDVTIKSITFTIN